MEKRKTKKRSSISAYGKGRDEEKGEMQWVNEREMGRVESPILSRLGIKGVLYDAVVYDRGFYLIALPPVRISQ